MDRLQELHAFIAVAETGGFSAASRRTGQPQPAVSKAVAALEKRLGVALFNRTTRSVALTDQGRRYFDRTRLMVEEWGDADNEVSNSALRVCGTVRISAASTFGSLHVLPLIPELLRRFPEIKVDVVLSDAVRDMVEDGIDLGIRVGSVAEPDAVVRRVATTPLVCVGSRRYFRERGVPQTPTDLVDHNCLVYGGRHEAASWPFIGPDGPIDMPVRGNLSSNSVETIRAGVAAGVGIGLFTRASMVGVLADADVTTVLDAFVRGARDVNLIWPRRRLVPARVRHTTEFLADAMAKRIAAAAGAGWSRHASW